ncbi:MAG: T9SS type A sorting domain-containing protein [candidate division WOR-3 bacterium]|nr:T9SS type A sorting domain-containing protein [candidate division WOR-3 bacterium]MDH5683608.1 T9SS type A sorting domain-containing protein [candidate division WOR-3 bacterium]
MKYLLFIIIPSLALSWNTPINLSQMYGDDINPQVCRSWNYLTHTCLVWQRRIGETWNIFARFSNWEGWDSIIRVTLDSCNNSDNENPAVAYTDFWRNKAWVVWQKSFGNNWEIFAAQGDTSGFDSPYQLTNSSDCRDENPSVFVISDTVWVTWQLSSAIETIPTRILAKFFNGTNWSDDFIIDQSQDPFCTNPKIHVRHNHPIIVYAKESRCYSHIYYSEYLNNFWTMPIVVCDSSGYNYNPEVIGEGPPLMMDSGAIILWHNFGSNDVFNTAYDTFNVHYRITCDSIVDISPTAITFDAPTLFEMMTIAWRRGDYIYSTFYYSPELVPVDTTGACDKPCLTADVFTRVWCIYQKYVGSDWEIFGTYEAYGIEEKQSNQIKAKRLISFNQLASFLRDKRYQVYDITGRVIRNNTDLRSGIYFIKIDGEKISAVFIR